MNSSSNSVKFSFSSMLNSNFNSIKEENNNHHHHHNHNNYLSNSNTNTNNTSNQQNIKKKSSILNTTNNHIHKTQINIHNNIHTNTNNNFDSNNTHNNQHTHHLNHNTHSSNHHTHHSNNHTNNNSNHSHHTYHAHNSNKHSNKYTKPTYNNTTNNLTSKTTMSNITKLNTHMNVQMSKTDYNNFNNNKENFKIVSSLKSSYTNIFQTPIKGQGMNMNKQQKPNEKKSSIFNPTQFSSQKKFKNLRSSIVNNIKSINNNNIHHNNNKSKRHGQSLYERLAINKNEADSNNEDDNKSVRSEKSGKSVRSGKSGKSIGTYISRKSRKTNKSNSTKINQSKHKHKQNDKWFMRSRSLKRYLKSRLLNTSTIKKVKETQSEFYKSNINNETFQIKKDFMREIDNKIFDFEYLLKKEQEKNPDFYVNSIMKNENKSSKKQRSMYHTMNVFEFLSKITKASKNELDEEQEQEKKSFEILDFGKKKGDISRSFGKGFIPEMSVIKKVQSNIKGINKSKEEMLNLHAAGTSIYSSKIKYSIRENQQKEIANIIKQKYKNEKYDSLIKKRRKAKLPDLPCIKENKKEHFNNDNEYINNEELAYKNSKKNQNNGVYFINNNANNNETINSNISLNMNKNKSNNNNNNDIVTNTNTNTKFTYKSSIKNNTTIYSKARNSVNIFRSIFKKKSLKSSYKIRDILMKNFKIDTENKEEIAEQERIKKLEKDKEDPNKNLSSNNFNENSEARLFFNDEQKQNYKILKNSSLLVDLIDDISCDSYESVEHKINPLKDVNMKNLKRAVRVKAIIKNKLDTAKDAMLHFNAKRFQKNRVVDERKIHELVRGKYKVMNSNPVISKDTQMKYKSLTGMYFGVKV